MRNAIASPTQQSPSSSRGIPGHHKRSNESQRCNCFIRNREKASSQQASLVAKCSSPATELNFLNPNAYVMQQQFNLLNPTNYVMHQQFKLLNPTG